MPTFSLKPYYTGAVGVEPAVTVLETVGLPLTDAPIPYLNISIRATCASVQAIPTLSLCAAYAYGKTGNTC